MILMRRPFASAEKYRFGLYNDMTGQPEATHIAFISFTQQLYQHHSLIPYYTITPSHQTFFPPSPIPSQNYNTKPFLTTSYSTTTYLYISHHFPPHPTNIFPPSNLSPPPQLLIHTLPKSPPTFTPSYSNPFLHPQHLNNSS